jgi:hypothetical protein
MKGGWSGEDGRTRINPGAFGLGSEEPKIA